MCLGFVLKSAGTQAGPADTALLGPSISVFGTIHPDIFRLRTPLGSGHRSERVRVASLEPQIRFDAPADAMGTLTDRSASACPSPSSVASLEERFAALADGRVAFEQRFAALTDGPVAFQTRFASTDDCPPSFDANLESAMEALASSLRPAPDQTVASANAVAKPVIPRARPRPAPVRRELPAIDDDGRTAIYDITARTVYLPSGRRLEAHSGFGAMMDNPRHVHVRMKGATPPNVYTLTLRERLFHGVRAIRLNPINDSRMYGRAGILAHTYMLGANGQSNGCVSFNDYDAPGALCQSLQLRVDFPDTTPARRGPQQEGLDGYGQRIFTARISRRVERGRGGCRHACCDIGSNGTKRGLLEDRRLPQPLHQSELDSDQCCHGACGRTGGAGKD